MKFEKRELPSAGFRPAISSEPPQLDALTSRMTDAQL